jgi:hypothetical protein
VHFGPFGLTNDAWAARYRERCRYVIYEITTDEGLWVPVTLEVGILNTTQRRTRSADKRIVLPLFLVHVAENAQIKDVIEAACERLTVFWTDERFQLSGEAIDLKASLQLSTQADDSGLRFLAAGKTRWPLTPMPELPFLVQTSVPIVLNEKYLKGFSLDRLVTWVTAPEAIRRAALASKVAVPSLELSKCLDWFEEVDQIGGDGEWRCPQCHELSSVSRQLRLWRAPTALMMELRRFHSTPYGLEKSDVLLSYPDEIDLTERVIGPQRGEQLKYRLYAVCEHVGSAAGGHYTAHAAVEEDGSRKWWVFNDATSSPSSSDGAHNEKAYVLFYERMPPGENAAEAAEMGTDQDFHGDRCHDFDEANPNNDPNLGRQETHPWSEDLGQYLDDESAYDPFSDCEV